MKILISKGMIMNKFGIKFVLTIFFLCVILFIGKNYQTPPKIHLSNEEIQDVVMQVIVRDESQMPGCNNEKKLTLCRYTILRYFPNNHKKTIDLCSILKDKKILCSELCEHCDIYLAEINVQNRKNLTVKVITNTVIIFYFYKQNNKWDLYKIVTKIIMDHPIIKIKKNGKWYIFSGRNKDLFQ